MEYWVASNNLMSYLPHTGAPEQLAATVFPSWLVSFLNYWLALPSCRSNSQRSPTLDSLHVCANVGCFDWLTLSDAIFVKKKKKFVTTALRMASTQSFCGPLDPSPRLWHVLYPRLIRLVWWWIHEYIRICWALENRNEMCCFDWEVIKSLSKATALR